MSQSLLHRTWLLTGFTALALTHWLFGNLYEQLVTAPAGLAAARPGALVGPLDLGSPVFYYGPSIPVTLTLVWILAERVRRSVPRDRVAVRATRAAALATTAAAALKVLLITSVNPGFRDASATPADVRADTVLWLAGNGCVVLLLATALLGVVAWRRPSRDLPGDDAEVRGGRFRSAIDRPVAGPFPSPGVVTRSVG